MAEEIVVQPPTDEDAPQPVSDMDDDFGEQIELIEQTRTFCEKNFAKLQTFIDEELAFLQQHNYQVFGELQLFGIKRFIDTAYNTMLELDAKLESPILSKIKEDVDNLFAYYSDFYRLTKHPTIYFEKKFLKTLPKYVALVKSFKEQQHSREYFGNQFLGIEEQLKKLNEKGIGANQVAFEKKLQRRNADAVHQFANARDTMKELYAQIEQMKLDAQGVFIPEFVKLRDDVLKKFKVILSSKIYILDKALWFHAADSEQILHFFQKSNIEGDFALKTYLNYYLKTVDMEVKSANIEWHKYLLKVVGRL